MDNEKYIENWLNNSLSEEDKRVFESTQDYQSIKKLDSALQQFKAPTYDVKEELARLNSKKDLKQKVIKVSWVQPVLKVAASITLVLLGYYLFFYNSATVIESTFAQKVELSLPDKSEVVLNASSRIAYVENTWDEKREVKLNGEAYFKVEKGARFNVKTATGVVTVLGTQFNVKVRDNYFEVICYEGLVAVTSGKHQVKLTPKHMIRIINTKIYSDSSLSDTAPSWILNESSFTSVPFEQVINEFERQYDVSITINKVDLSQLFTGRFTHDDISLALKSISLPLKLEYEFENDKQIVLTGNIK